MRSLALLALGLGVLGCARGPLRTAWVEDAKLAYEPSRYPDDAAVVLYRADRTQLIDEANSATTRLERHEVIAVQGEGGFGLAEVKVPYAATDKLVEFHARIVQPDGARQEFDAKDFLSDVSAKGERQVNASFFRFPDVRVGSKLEYRWVVESERFYNADDQDTLGVFPVKAYEFELTASKPLVLETISFNSSSPIEVRTAGNGDHQLRFSLSDLPPRRDADFAPHWTFTEPRWAWRVLAYKARAVTYDWLRDWSDVVENRGRRYFVDGELYDGFAPQADFTGCGDVTCRVQRALDFVRSKTSAAGVAWARAEPLKAALESGKASITERALMLKALLERQGVDVWLAFGTDRLSAQTSPSFPRFAEFNHLFVYLPAQEGLSRPLTLDPDCDFCAPGQLTARHLDLDVYVFRTSAVLDKASTEGRWVKAAGEPAQGSMRKLLHRAQVQADGAVHDEVQGEARGLQASGAQQGALHAPKKLVGSERDFWRQANPRADVRHAAYEGCEKAGRCGWLTRLTFPQQATRVGPDWLVQLSLLSTHHGTLFDAPTRELDIHFSWDDFVEEEVLELEAPPGTRLVRAPDPVRVNAGPLSAEVTVVRTESGARVRRVLTRRVGEVRRANYDEVRAAADAWKQARQLVLTFAPK